MFSLVLIVAYYYGNKSLNALKLLQNHQAVAPFREFDDWHGKICIKTRLNLVMDKKLRKGIFFESIRIKKIIKENWERIGTKNMESMVKISLVVQMSYTKDQRFRSVRKSQRICWFVGKAPDFFKKTRNACNAIRYFLKNVLI